MKWIKCILWMIVFLTCISFALGANLSEYENDVNLFYSYTCPHCEDEIEFLEEIEGEYNVDFNYFEVTKSSNEENKELFEEFAEKYDSSSDGVPRTFIGDKYFIGFDEGEGSYEYSAPYKAHIGYKNQIRKAIEELEGGVNGSGENETGDGPGDDSSGLIKNLGVFLIILLYLPTYFIFRKKIKENAQNKRYWISGLAALFIICIFIFLLMVPDSTISSSAKALPFPLFVFVISLADGFNPCAFTVLFILLSLLTYTNSKKNMLTVGGVFILTSAVMYFIFIMLMVFVGSIFIEKFGTIILTILGVGILIAGLINLKDYMMFKKGVSLSIPDEKKSKITKKARNIIKSLREGSSFKHLLIALGGTIVLAVGVNIVELGCTAILPVVYMSVLIGNYGSSIGVPHLMWTIFYSLIYILPLLGILGTFIFTFKSERISEEQGRILKLVGGLFMLLAGFIMTFKPELLMMG